MGVPDAVDYLRILGAESRKAWLEEASRSLTDKPDQPMCAAGAPNAMGLTVSYLEQCQVLFDVRYRYIPKTLKYADTWMEMLQTLIFCSADGGYWARRRGTKALEKWLRKLRTIEGLTWPEAGTNQGTGTALMAEWANVVYLYLYLCERDHTFGSVFFGLGRRKPQSIRNKLDAVITPLLQNLSEPWMRSSTRLAWEAYCTDHPVVREEPLPF